MQVPRRRTYIGSPRTTIPARLQGFEYLVHSISGTIRVTQDPALGGRPPNILRRSLDRNRAQLGRMAGLRQLELSVPP